MAFRVSSSGSSLTSPSRPGLSVARMEAGVGAFNLKHQEDLPLSKGYNGKAALLEFSFPAIPGITGAIVAGIKNGPFIPPKIKAGLLRIEVWQDPTPTFDRYQVRVWVAGEIPDSQDGAGGVLDPKNPVLPSWAEEELIEGGIGDPITIGTILTILLVVSVLVILGVITWKLSKLDFGEAAKGVGGGLMILGIVGIGAWMVLRALDQKQGARHG